MITRGFPWRDLFIGGGVLVGGLLIYDAISKGLGFEGVKGTAQSLGATLGSALIAIPTGIAEAVGAQEFGAAVWEKSVGAAWEGSNVLERVAWGDLQPGQTAGYQWVPSPLGIPMPIPVKAPETVQLGPKTKSFLINAPWRTDPQVQAKMQPWMIQHLEAERARYVAAGLIPQ